MEISDGNPYYSAEMTEEFAEVAVFHGGIARLGLLGPRLLIGTELKIIKVNNGEKHAKHYANNGIKE